MARSAWRGRLGDGFAPRLRDGGYGTTGATEDNKPRQQTQTTTNPNKPRRSTVSAGNFGREKWECRPIVSRVSFTRRVGRSVAGADGRRNVDRLNPRMKTVSILCLNPLPPAPSERLPPSSATGPAMRHATAPAAKQHNRPEGHARISLRWRWRDDLQHCRGGLAARRVAYARRDRGEKCGN